MLKAVRRSVALPSLSISIPPPPDATPNGQENQRSESSSNGHISKGEGSEKTVTFLAPDESAVNDDQSICQSPTWEGYKEAEKRKKEEKKQKRKEKEQAAKDAKLAKKRLTARLSKAAPSIPSSKEPSPAPQDRQLLRSATEPLNIEYPQDGSGDSQHTLSQLTGQLHVPSSKRPPTKGTKSFVGGVKFTSQSEEIVKRLAEARERAIERDNAAATNPTSIKPRAFAITPSTMSNKLGRKKEKDCDKDSEKTQDPVSRPPVTKHGLFRQRRRNSTPSISAGEDVPEASRTTVVSHTMSTPALIQQSPAVSTNDLSRGRPGSASDTGYVKSSRRQSLERAITGFTDEHKVAGFFSRLRPSFHASNQPQVNSTPDNIAQHAPNNEEVLDFDSLKLSLPPPLVSSPALSEVSSRGSQRGQSPSRQLEPYRVPASPTFSFTSGMTSYFEHQPLASQLVDSPNSSVTESTGGAPKIPEVASTPTLTSEFNLATTPLSTVRPAASSHQSNSRTSERSSSSSLTDSQDTSPISPATTPNTSRPQSQKGGVGAQKKGISLVQDKADSDTSPGILHEMHFCAGKQGSVKSSNASSKTFKDSEDGWSRSALHLDFDRQSLMTSMSNLEFNDSNISKTSLHQKPLTSSPSSNTSSQFEDAQESLISAETTNRSHEYQSSDRDVSFLPPLKHQPLGGPTKGKGASKSESRIFPVINTSQGTGSRSMSPAPSNTSRPDTLRPDDSSESSSGPATYLQEARKNTLAPPPATTLRTIQHTPVKNSGLRQSTTTQNKPDFPDKPMAKMFVECCNCKFFHDMPSKVYECMVNPDSLVEDRRLGVSGAITTMVKCPWCAHNMSKECCAGYMAMVMLQQRLH